MHGAGQLCAHAPDTQYSHHPPLRLHLPCRQNRPSEDTSDIVAESRAGGCDVWSCAVLHTMCLSVFSILVPSSCTVLAVGGVL